MLSRYELFKEKMINGSAVKLAAIEEVEKTIEQIIRQLLQAGLNEKETLELILDIVKRKLEESTQKQKLCEAIGDANSYTTAGKLEIRNYEFRAIPKEIIKFIVVSSSEYFHNNAK